MAGSDANKYEEFDSVYRMPVEFIEYIQQTLGVVNKFRDFDHFFQNAELFMTLIRRTQSWLLNGADTLSKDSRYAGKLPKEMPKEAYEKIWKVWRGKIWRICVTEEYLNEDDEIIVSINADKSYFVYDRPTVLLPDEKAVPVPALQNLNPISQTKDMTEFGVRIREEVDFSIAWFGYDYAMLNTDGKFHYNFMDEQRPFFKSDEQLLELKQKTSYVSRDYFHTVIDIECEEYEKWETPLFLFLQSLIKLIKGMSGEAMQGSDEDQTFFDYKIEEPNEQG